MTNIAAGLAAIIGTNPIVDQSTRTLIYEATNRTSEYALRYFQDFVKPAKRYRLPDETEREALQALSDALAATGGLVHEPDHTRRV